MFTVDRKIILTIALERCFRYSNIVDIDALDTNSKSKSIVIGQKMGVLISTDLRHDGNSYHGS